MTMSLEITSFVTIIFFLQIIVGEYTELDERFKRQAEAVQEFKCGPPQPRCVNLEDLRAKELKILPSEKVLPAHTVLHKCDAESGCCEGHLQCSEDQSERIKLYFQICNAINEKCAEKTVFARNHTKCVCKEPSIPKR